LLGLLGEQVVKAQFMGVIWFALFLLMAMAPTLCVGALSKMGVQLVPPLLLRQTPPEAAPA
jgi:hypothetical protein